MAERMTQEHLFGEGKRLAGEIERLERTLAEVRVKRPWPVTACIPPNNSISVRIPKATATRLIQAEITRLTASLQEVKRNLK
jgi:hypothetical protein